MRLRDQYEGVVVPLQSDGRLRDVLAGYLDRGFLISKDPMVISSFPTSQVHVLGITPDGMVVAASPSFNTYGASVNKINMCLFGQKHTIPSKVLEEMHFMTDIEEISRTFGDSIEKTLWIKKLMDAEGVERR